MKRNPQLNDDEGLEPQTQAMAELVPPSRKPPTAVGAGTSPWPPRPPRPRRQRTGAGPILGALRAGAGVLIDAADALAGTIQRTLGWRV